MTRGCMLSDFSATLGEIPVFDLNKQNNLETNEMDALNLMGCRTHVYIYTHLCTYIVPLDVSVTGFIAEFHGLSRAI